MACLLRWVLLGAYIFICSTQLPAQVEAQSPCNILGLAADDSPEWRGLVRLDGRWPDQLIPVKFEAPTQVELAAMLEAVQEVNAQTNVCLVPHTDEFNFVSIQWNTEGLNSSYIGRTGGRQVVQIATTRTGIIVHELGHVLGLYHEHQRPDRDSFVRILEDNVLVPFLHNFSKKYDGLGLKREGPYDYESLMHYPNGAFSYNGLPTILTIPPGIPIGQQDQFSEGDIAAINALYPQDLGDCRDVIREKYPPIMARQLDSLPWQRCTNTSIELTTALAFIPGTEIEWHIKGGNPSFSTLHDPKVSFYEPGSYLIRLKTRNNGEVREYEQEVIIHDAELSTQLYPNPSSGAVQFNTTGRSLRPLHLALFNSVGQLIWEDNQMVSTDCYISRDLDFSAFPAGTYFFTARNTEYRQLFRLVIVH